MQRGTRRNQPRRKRNPKKTYPQISVHFLRKKMYLGEIVTRIEIRINFKNCSNAENNLLNKQLHV